MRSKASPFNTSYQKYVIDRRKDRKPSKKQFENAAAYGKAFVIHKDAPSVRKLHEDDVKRGKNRRNVDEALEERRLRVE